MKGRLINRRTSVFGTGVDCSGSIFIYTCVSSFILPFTAYRALHQSFKPTHGLPMCVCVGGWGGCKANEALGIVTGTQSNRTMSKPLHQ